MPEIRRLFFARHLRGEVSAHILQSKDGQVVRSGRGLAFWFLPLATSIAEVPLDDRDLPYLFHGRTADFQDVVTQGVLSWRVADAELLARRLDFTIDLATGAWKGKPLEQVAQLLTELAQQQAWAYLAHEAVRDVLRDGVERLRERLDAALRGAPELAAMGIEIVTVRVSSVRPTVELEKALQTPTREALQQEADKATFERRALAVERERAIAENELRNRIELAKREEELIGQQGANQRRRATEEAESVSIEHEASLVRQRSEAESRRAIEHADATSSAELVRMAAAAKAEAERLAGEAQAAVERALGDARAQAERARVDALADAPREVVWAWSLREIGTHLPSIEHLNLSPDVFGPALVRLADHVQRPGA